MSFFSRLKYGSYTNSRRAKLYEKMAEEYKVPAQHIFEIAHGKKAKSVEDIRLLDDLLARGVIVNK